MKPVRGLGLKTQFNYCRGETMEHSIFNQFEIDLLDAAKMVLHDGLRRIGERTELFPTNREKSRKVDRERREARDALSQTLIADYGHLRHEVAVVALIDAQGRLIGVENFGDGHATHCEIRPRLLAEKIVRTGAVAVLLAHVHPSGLCQPSQQDIEMTKQMDGWLAAMDCYLIDHLVITVDECCSIKGEW
jgi:DNA repair protein RadC